MAIKDVDQHIQGIITSSPFLRFSDLAGLQRALTANKFADEPELTITAYFWANEFSKSFFKF